MSGTELELYHADRSTCSQKVRICLAEIGLEYKGHQIDLASGEQLSPEYLKINPNGVVPALRHGSAVIIESTVICEYLCEVFPNHGMLPDDAVARAHLRAWLRYIDEVPSMAIRVPSYQHALIGYFKSMSDEEFKAYIDAKPIRKYFFRNMGKDGFSKKEYDAAIEQVQRTVERMEVALGTTEWLAHCEFSLADICMAPVFQRLEDLELEYLWKDFDRVTEWYARTRERPSYDTAFYPGTFMTNANREAMFGEASHDSFERCRGAI